MISIGDKVQIIQLELFPDSFNDNQKIGKVLEVSPSGYLVKFEDSSQISYVHNACLKLCHENQVH